VPNPVGSHGAPSPDRLWSVEDVSAYLGVPVQTLYAWRKRRTGPPCARIGKHLRYDPATVRTWVAEQTAA
jgi:predicted DNA-binding transcriptional regulator AlpA